MPHIRPLAVRDRMDELDLTFADLATCLRATGLRLTEGTVRNIVSGYQSTSRKTARRICKVLDLDPADHMLGDEHDSPAPAVATS